MTRRKLFVIYILLKCILNLLSYNVNDSICLSTALVFFVSTVASVILRLLLLLLNDNVIIKIMMMNN